MSLTNFFKINFNEHVVDVFFQDGNLFAILGKSVLRFPLGDKLSEYRNVIEVNSNIVDANLVGKRLTILTADRSLFLLDNTTIKLELKNCICNKICDFVNSGDDIYLLGDSVYALDIERKLAKQIFPLFEEKSGCVVVSAKDDASFILSDMWGFSVHDNRGDILFMKSFGELITDLRVCKTANDVYIFAVSKDGNVKIFKVDGEEVVNVELGETVYSTYIKHSILNSFEIYWCSSKGVLNVSKIDLNGNLETKTYQEIYCDKVKTFEYEGEEYIIILGRKSIDLMKKIKN